MRLLRTLTADRHGRAVTVTAVVCGLVASCLLTVGVVPTGAAHAAPSDGVATVTGLLHHVDGSPFAAGAPFTLFAIAATPADSAIGASTTAEPVATGAVGTDGAFAVRLDDAAGLRPFADADGVVDLEVRAVDAGDYAPFSLSRRLVVVDGRDTLVSPDSDAVSGTTSRNSIGAAADPTDAGIVSAVASGVDPSAVGVAAPANPARAGAAQPRTQICGETLEKNIGARKVLLGATYTAVSGTSSRFTYSSGATSSLGVAYSISGAKGTWKQGGTVSTTATSAIDFGKRTGGNAYSTYFNFAKYAQWCRPLGGTQNVVYDHVVKANRYTGGSSVSSAPIPNAPYCSSFSPRTTLTRTTSTANVWSKGVDFAGPLGIDLSSKTGWTSSASMSYTTSTATRKICGTSDHWGGTPKRAVVR
jgi:hypothetical protein